MPHLDPQANLDSQTSSTLPGWNIRGIDFCIFICLTLSCMAILSMLGARIGNWYQPSQESGELSLFTQLGAAFGMQLGLGVGYLVFTSIVKRARPALPAQTPIARAIVVGLKWLLIGYLAAIAVGFLWTESLTLLGFEKTMQEAVRLATEVDTLSERLVTFAVVAVAAPICEELVFRGAVFRFLQHRIHLYGALGLSALVFAALHLSLFSFAPLLAIGIALALAYRESGTLLSSMTFHSAFNTINFAIIINFPELV